MFRLYLVLLSISAQTHNTARLWNSDTLWSCLEEQLGVMKMISVALLFLSLPSPSFILSLLLPRLRDQQVTVNSQVITNNPQEACRCFTIKLYYEF